MFRYIDMPKLVAFYLREFSSRADGTPSLLYKFVFCLCLPFVSATFREARLRALAIAECTNSADQIARLMKKLTGADVTFSVLDADYFASFDGTDETADFTYNGEDETPLVPYTIYPNAAVMRISLNGASRDAVETYARLLIPFYVETYKIWI